MSIFAFHVFDIIYDITFLFVVIGKTHEKREPQSSRINIGEIAVTFAISFGKYDLFQLLCVLYFMTYFLPRDTKHPRY